MTETDIIDKDISPEILKNPFKGPDSYAESDTLCFYGRDEERSDLINLVEQNTLTLLYSRSGTGKSSLINAGLIPVLKKSIFYFPVYIRLSDEMINAEVKTFSEAVVKIIKDQAVKRKVRIEINKDSNITMRADPTITEFLYFSEFISDVNEKVIPVIIFDQFEEIFSRQFRKASIIDLIEDLSYVIESRMPPIFNSSSTANEHEIFGKDLFKNCSEEQIEDEINSLRSNLMQNLQDYRFLFSFRDEYLPRFESLMNKLPSIFKMSGRLNLQTFSIPLASKVINRISKTSVEIEKDLCDQLTNIISSSDKKYGTQFSGTKDEVQPFLLSLVCRKIYPEITGSAANKKIIEQIEKEDSQIVDNIVSEYTEEIFSRVSKKTRKFVEEELITENERRKLFPLSEVEDSEVITELNDLSKEQNLRYLNVVQYFNSSNVEILHDRLLKPLILSRKKRREKEEADILNEKKEKIEAESRFAKTKMRNRVLLIALVSFIAGLIILYTLLNSYDPFLIKINKVSMEKLSAEIPENSIGALINIAGYQKSVDSIGNIAGLDLLPNFMDPLVSTKRNLSNDIIDAFKTTPFFFAVADSSASRFSSSPKANYKYFIKSNSEPDQRQYLEFYKLKNDSIPVYTYLGRTNDMDIQEEPRSSFRGLPGMFSPDEKYFVIAGAGNTLIFDLEKISGKAITPIDSITSGKNVTFFKFSSDSKLLLFKDKSNKEYYYIKPGESDGNKFNKLMIPVGSELYDALVTGTISYIAYRQTGEDQNNYYFYNGTSAKPVVIENCGDLVITQSKIFIGICNDSLKVFDLNTFQMEGMKAGIQSLTNVSNVENKNQIIVSNRSGEVELYDIGEGKAKFKTKFDNFDPTVKKSNYFNNLVCFSSEINNCILLGYNNQFRVYDLSKKENEEGYRSDFGFLKMNVRYAYFNPDISVTIIDTRGNMIKWHYGKKAPSEIGQVQNYSDSFKKVYGEKNFQFQTEFIGRDPAANRSWLNRVRWY